MKKEITLDELARMIAEGFAQTATKKELIAVDTRLNRVEKKVEIIDQRLSRMEIKIETVIHQPRMRAVESRVTVLEQKNGIA